MSASILAGMYASEISNKNTGSPLEFKFEALGTKSKKVFMWVGIVAVIAAVGGGVGYYVWKKKKATA